VQGEPRRLARKPESVEHIADVNIHARCIQSAD
jgi:hypothetical protein